MSETEAAMHSTFDRYRAACIRSRDLEQAGAPRGESFNAAVEAARAQAAFFAAVRRHDARSIPSIASVPRVQRKGAA